MLGHIMEWFYRAIIGIDQSSNSIAFKEIVVDPRTPGDVHAAQGSFDCLYGTIATEWKKENDSFELRVMIPPNTSAIVYLPAKAHSRIFEHNRSIGKGQDVKVLGYRQGKLKLRVGSGSYFFVVKD